MIEVLVACGDVELLKRIVSDIPTETFKAIATKKGTGTAQKVAGRAIQMAVVHVSLSDGTSDALRADLKQTFAGIPILLLGTSEKSDNADHVLNYPVPGPVLRNAIKRLAPSGSNEQDMVRWKQFYDELGTLEERLTTQSYYEILGLQPGAPHHAIVSVYDHISMRYHPDKYTQFRGEKWGDAIYQRCNGLYKLFTEAFAVLSDRKLRKSYDVALSKGQNRLAADEVSGQDSGPQTLDAVATHPQAKKFLKLAQSDIAKQNWQSALQNLRFAKSMEPSDIIAQKIAEIEQKLK